jgi:predicted oxidoreductase
LFLIGTDGEGVEYRSNYCKQQYGSKMIEKETIWHKVSGVKNYWWKHTEEEYRGRER